MFIWKCHILNLKIAQQSKKTKDLKFSILNEFKHANHLYLCVTFVLILFIFNAFVQKYFTSIH